MSRTTFYHATLCLHGPLVVTKDEEHGDIKAAVVFRDKQFPLNVKRKLAALLEDKPPEGDQGIILWPRTDKERLLGNGTQLALYKSVGELGREPGLHAPGELVKVDKENALLQLQLHPNEKQGKFEKTVQAAAGGEPRAARGVAGVGQWLRGVGGAEAAHGACCRDEGTSRLIAAQARASDPCTTTASQTGGSSQLAF